MKTSLLVTFRLATRLSFAVFFLDFSLMAQTDSPWAVSAHPGRPVESDGILNPASGGNWNTEIDLFKKLGTKVVRTDFSYWSFVDSYNSRTGVIAFNTGAFYQHDKMVTRFLNEGIEISGTLNVYGLPPADAYRKFASEVARHFKGRVKYYEVGN